MKMAEKKYRKPKMDGYDYSPEFSRLSNMLILWTLVLRQLSGRKACAKIIIQQQQKGGI